jgi:diketogulonate reductase-like aldo/keto reductase
VTSAQLAIARVASRGEDIILLIGTKRRDRLTEALKALDLTLSTDELAAVEAAVPAEAVAGTGMRRPRWRRWTASAKPVPVFYTATAEGLRRPQS